MGSRAAPPPDDARWTAPAINLLRAAVLLDAPYDLARTWAVGTTRTALGTTFLVSKPLVPSVPSYGRDVDLPLMGLAGVVLLHALTTAGADPVELARVVRVLEEEHGPAPLAAHQAVTVTLPPDLASAATDRAEPSLLRPLVSGRDGWRFTAPVLDALAVMDHDADGWVTRVRLAGGTVDVSLGRTSSPSVAGADAARAVLTMFREGHSLVYIAAALGCSVDDIEAALRRQV